MTRKTAALAPCLWLAILHSTAARGGGAGPPGGWSPEAMLGVKQVGGVQVSPDGKRVAFVVRRAVVGDGISEFVSQVHVADVDGSFPLTRGEKSCEGPQWSPDGEQIAFLTARSGKPQVWAIRARGGEARRLTDAKGEVVGFRWSPDGRRIAYAATDPAPGEREKRAKQKDDARVVDETPRRNGLYVIDVAAEEDAREGRRLTGGGMSVYADAGPGFDWSPDGAAIAFAHTPTAAADDWTRSDISVVDARTGAVTPLARTGRAESAPSYSPDGRRVAFVASDDPPTWAFDSAVYVVDAGGGTPRKLADSFDHRPELLGWSADGARLLYRENRGTTTRLYALPLDGEPEGLGPDDGAVAEAYLNPTRTAIGYGFQTESTAPEAYRLRLDGTAPARVSRVNADLPDFPLGRTETIRWKAKDDREIEGLLTYPVGYEEGKKYPLLLIIHGGPAGVFARTFIASPTSATSGGRHSTSAYPVAAFAARGYAVLRCNVRGSSGYGKDFRHANLKDWGGGDFQDLMAGADHVVSRGVADPERLGVMGWSYGGFMTSWVIGHTGRFKAASVGAGVTDLVSFSGTADIASFLPSYFGGEPWDRADSYRQHSPIAHVRGVKTPTLIQHGEDDERVPIAQGYELYNALKRQGCTVTMVTYPRTHHAIQEPKLLLDAMRRNLEWFDQYLRGPDTAAESRRHAARKPVVADDPPGPATAARKPRARDLGVPFEGTPGPLDAITDVRGVEVGHTTLIAGEGKLEVGKGPIRTGVTAILPRGKGSAEPVFAGWFSLNGNGEMTGTTWVEESGLLEGPVMITNTHSVGVVRDAVIAHRVRGKRSDPSGFWWSLPVVAETWDGYLNDVNGFHVRPEHVFAALDGARPGPVPEGNVGGGTGMVCHGFKGGIGTASRALDERRGGYTVGILVQANHGLREQLRIAGVPVGREIRDGSLRRKEAGSIIIVVATDAPLLPHQLKRLARRAALGLARTGSVSGNGSGDLFLAFSTAKPEAGKSGQNEKVEMLPNERIDPLLEATVQATEEAIVNALVAAETMTGVDGHRVVALPHDRLKHVLKQYNRLDGLGN
jgi:dipeptidyl aminopeptidase/acylaminoacyl peptidase/L-aminopeptidase/D-esterase-like protein